ncbi:hypothetical protein [Streptomyces macrosporus]|uniref:Uncharacterized protein n=1 Tax=Streptomyces macrosporus TaxID=44032 RepID=A0ABP5XK10_9ACTN
MSAREPLTPEREAEHRETLAALDSTHAEVRTVAVEALAEVERLRAELDEMGAHLRQAAGQLATTQAELKKARDRVAELEQQTTTEAPGDFTARDLVVALRGAGAERDAVEAAARERLRAEVLNEAASVAKGFADRFPDFDAMKAAGIIGPHTASRAIHDELRRMADAAGRDEMAASLARDGFGPDEINAMQHRPTESVPVRWAGAVTFPDNRDDGETVVCCTTDTGRRVALRLNDEHREALGLALLLPDGDGELVERDAHRAEVLREAADEIEADYPPESGYDRGRAWAVAELRRMATEAGGAR